MSDIKIDPKQHPVDVSRGEAPHGRAAPEIVQPAASALPPAYIEERDFHRKHLPENNQLPPEISQPPAQRELALTQADRDAARESQSPVASTMPVSAGPELRHQHRM
jgi:hypothetical protein